MEMYNGEFLTGMSKDMQSCIKACTMTKSACEQMMTICMKNAKWTGMNKCMMALQCCVSICETACMMMTCESKQCEAICKTCADVCMTCAEECEKMKGTDKIFKMCADMCRTCADCCKSVCSH